MSFSNVIDWLLDLLNIGYTIKEVTFNESFLTLYTMANDLMHSVLDFLTTLFWEYTFTFGPFDLTVSMYSLIAYNVGMVIGISVLVKIVIEIIDLIS